jgi:hypothetical protein
MSQPAPWTTVEQTREFCSFTREMPDSQVLFLIQSATDVLYYHSAQQFNGGLVDVIRTCKQPSCLNGMDFSFYPAATAFGPDGPYPYIGAQTCGCSALSEVSFDKNPVIAVNEIIINGTVFPEYVDGFQNWRIDDARWLVRLDGNPWPQCQDLILPITEVGTWQITYTYGRLAPEMGVLACLQLTCELAKAQIGERCQLPARTTRVIRQGVSIQMQDIKNDEERTGLYNVDLFLRTYNPNSLRSETYLWSPDLPARGRRVTG